MNIYESIHAVMADCGAIAKSSVNPQQNYKFRGIDAVMNALNPALVKNKVFVVPDVLDQKREERQTPRGGTLIYSIVRVKYTFYAEDGSYVCACVVGEGMDSGDKATNKAMSAAFKYACFQTFCIPTEEMRDSEEDSPEVMAKAQDVETQKISKLKALALIERCEKDGVNIEKLQKTYKISALEELTEKQHSNICQFWEKVKETCGNDRQA